MRASTRKLGLVAFAALILAAAGAAIHLAANVSAPARAVDARQPEVAPARY